MDAALTDLSDDALREAIEQNLFAFWSALAASPHVTVEDGRDFLRYTTGIAHPFMNGIMRARLPANDDAIKDAMGPILAVGLPMMWWTGPSDTPLDLGERLERLGCVLAGEDPGMAVDLEKVPDETPPSELEVTQVRDAVGCRALCVVIGASFELPELVTEAFDRIIADVGFGPDAPVVSFVGRIDGEPVGGSSVMLGAGVAGVYNIGTIAEARGRGVGRAMTLAACLHGRARGYRAAILHSTEAGYPVYQRLGFREYCKVRQYVWMAE